MGNSVHLPTRIFLGNSLKILSVATSRDFCLILTREGNVFSWGENQFGQLGHGDYDVQKIPKKIRGNLLENCHVSEIAAGKKHSVARSRDGRIFVWGAGEDGKKFFEEKNFFYLKIFFFRCSGFRNFIQSKFPA